jgi:hypothetical protein
LFLAHANKQERKKERKKERKSQQRRSREEKPNQNPYQKREKETRQENAIQARSKTANCLVFKRKNSEKKTLNFSC